jgi:1-deoxy-D-xylulose-5-phosphate synthase
MEPAANSPVETTSLGSEPSAPGHELGQRLREAVLRRAGPGTGAALGAVELAVAIRSVVPTPETNVFWDSGDHALPFALLAGGDSEDLALPSDGPGRAISDAVGLAVVRTLRRDPTPVVAVIDGMGLSTGLAFEAVNHAGHLQLPLVLVLIDGQSPRGRSAGAVARYLTRLRGHTYYSEAKALIEQALGRVPAGEQALEMARRLKNSIRELLLPTEMWEELLGFMYLGPVDGHHPGALREILSLALRLHRPVVLHVATERGRGLGPGATDAAPPRRVPPAAWEAALAAAVSAAVEGDEQTVVVTASARLRAALARVAEAAPERFFDAALGEAHAVAFASSVAAGGMRPVVAIGASHAAAALAPVAAECAGAPSPVTLVVHPDRMEARRDPADLRIACAIEGLDVVVPATEADLDQMVRQAADTGRWTLVRLPGSAPSQDVSLPVPGRHGYGLREGADPGLAIVAVGPLLSVASEAAEQLGAWTLGVARLSPELEPPIDSVGRWLLVDDPEFGPALSRAWPRAAHAATSTVLLQTGSPPADHVAAIVAAARGAG